MMTLPGFLPKQSRTACRVPQGRAELIKIGRSEAEYVARLTPCTVILSSPISKAMNQGVAAAVAPGSPMLPRPSRRSEAVEEPSQTSTCALPAHLAISTEPNRFHAANDRFLQAKGKVGPPRQAFPGDTRGPRPLPPPLVEWKDPPNPLFATLC